MDQLPERPLYTALGNCQAAGAGGPLLITVGYVRVYRRLLVQQLERRLRLCNYGYLFGLYLHQMLRDLYVNENMISDLRQSHVVTFNIGENELLRAERAAAAGDRGAPDFALSQFRELYPQLVDRLLELVPPGQAIIRTMNIYNPRPQHPLSRYVDDFNHVIFRHTQGGRNAQRRVIPMADVHRRFSAGSLDQLLAPDRTHLSRRGHRAIGQALAELGLTAV